MKGETKGRRKKKLHKPHEKMGVCIYESDLFDLIYPLSSTIYLFLHCRSKFIVLLHLDKGS